MKRSTVLWIIAFVITIGSALFQRLTGPTYPVSGTARLMGAQIRYHLDRSHGGEGGAPVHVVVPIDGAAGWLLWRHFRSEEPPDTVLMTRRGDTLMTSLPYLPPAGKVEYRIRLRAGDDECFLPADGPIVLRYKGEVPVWILAIHIVAMFAAMLFSTRAGLEVFAVTPEFKALTYWTLGTLILGGMILGPFVQRYAFGAYWTGWPFGTDLTDNKTLIAFLGWIAAGAAVRYLKKPAVWVVLASILMLAVFMIPHSLRGSERITTGQHAGGVIAPARPGGNSDHGLDNPSEIY